MLIYFQTSQMEFLKGCRVFVVETPPELQGLIKFLESALVPTDQTGWYDWIKQFDPLEPRDISSPGAMIYTSGTTGRPKGVRRKSGTRTKWTISMRL